MISELERVRDEIRIHETVLAELRADRVRLARLAIEEGVRPSVVARALEVTTQYLAELRRM